MPLSDVPRNPFLADLLSLQQDGRDAISAPTNWTRSRPLLEVETDLDKISTELAETCLLGTSNKVARWHFFIGSPGNGKSATVGKLVRALLEKHCRIIDEHGTDILSLGTTTVPYSLDVYEPDRAFCSVRIIQDASVVRNPYAIKVDPSRDLLETLRDAWDAGISLIVCTNRGVLEKAYRDTHLDPKFKSLPWHHSILGKLAVRDEATAAAEVALPFTGRKSAFGSVAASSTFLDKLSLILREVDILDRLIQKAVSPTNWAACSSCDVATMCPFRANRDWLADPNARKGIINTLRRAEVLSSQIIVFREALAIISFLLAGCARDYKDTDPCGWVRRLNSRGDIFGLASRRLHMCLYVTSSPRGLDSGDGIRARQVEALRKLRTKMVDFPNLAAATNALSAALEESPPSADVGVARLLGGSGVFSRLDAINGPLPGKFSDAWDGNYERMLALRPPLVAELDRACLAAWKVYENFAENLSTHEAELIHWSVRRWSSQYTLHLGAMAEERVLDLRELDEFTELLELLWKDKASRTKDEKRRQAELERQIAALLNRGGIDGDDGERAVTIISENVAVLGNWIDEKMKPGVHASGASGSLTIGVSFGSSAAQTALAAPMYLWLRQRAKGTMDPRCIPPELLSDAMDAKSRAVSRSLYAFEPNHVALRIDGAGGVFNVERYDGEAITDVQP